MKHFVLAATLLSSSAFAGTFSGMRLDRIFNSAERAEWQVSKYNAQTINWKREIAKIAQARSKSCGEPSLTDNRYELLKALKSYYHEDALAAKLNELYGKRLIVAGAGGFDGSDGEPEYCSTSSFKFFTRDGEVLEIFYDYNT